MSGTPSISESYSLLASPPGDAVDRRLELRVSLVVLARGPWVFRPQVVAEACRLGFSEVLFVEEGRPRYDPVHLVRTWPGLRILVPSAPLGPGARINLAAREVTGDRFLVLWDDQSLPEAGLLTRVQKLWADQPVLAIAPELKSRDGRELPSVQVPGLEGDRLKILALGADEEIVDTLFPADYTALYDRRLFLATGGFDPGLASPFWQKADWGLRSRLWGERLVLGRAFQVSYRSALPSEDQTPDRTYPRFWLRNLAVRFAGDHGVLPLSRFWAYTRRSGLGWAEGLGSFLRERAWVKTHRYRFQSDARLLAELWGEP